MQITRQQLDSFFLAVDSYSTISAHRQRHHATRFKEVVRLYAKMTGMTQKEAHECLFDILP